MDKLFERAVALIKRYGYRIYGFKENGYAFFTDGKNIGYFQTNVFGHLSFSTVHRPNRIAGTGYKVATEITSVDEITEDLCKMCFVSTPEGFTPVPVNKWENWDDFAGKGWSSKDRTPPELNVIEVDLDAWESAACPIDTSKVDKSKVETAVYHDMRMIWGYDDYEIITYLNGEGDDLKRDRFHERLSQEEEKQILIHGGIYYEDKLNIRGCWTVVVEQENYRYQFGVYVCYDSTPEDIIDIAYQNGLFDFGESDKEVAVARPMTEEEQVELGANIHILAME